MKTQKRPRKALAHRLGTSALSPNSCNCRSPGVGKNGPAEHNAHHTPTNNRNAVCTKRCRIMPNMTR
eukprot:7809951-Alexandrium_andersonii.AAC.1